MTEFHPYISFPGNGKQAFDFYQSVFGGEVLAMSYDDFPPEAAAQFPFELPKGALAHATLRGGMVTLSGGDAIGADLPGLASDVYSFLLYCDTVEQARDIVATLEQEEGELIAPVELAPWGQYYGQVRDQFGVLWAVNVICEDQRGE